MSQILFLKNKYHFYNFSSSLFWSSFNGSTTPHRKRKGLWGPAYLLILPIFVSCCFLPKTLIFFPLHPSHLSPPPPPYLPLPPLDQQILPVSLKRTMALRPPYFCSGWTISFLFPLCKSQLSFTAQFKPQGPYKTFFVFSTYIQRLTKQNWVLKRLSFVQPLFTAQEIETVAVTFLYHHHGTSSSAACVYTAPCLPY